MPNKTITVLTAPAKVIHMDFYPMADGSVVARIAGSTTISDGTPLAATSYEVKLPAGHAIAVSVQALAAGQALSYWKTQEGL